MKNARWLLSLALVCLMLLTTGCSAIMDGVSDLLRDAANRLDPQETVAAQEEPAQLSKDEGRSEETQTEPEDETPAAQKDAPALDLGDLGNLGDLGDLGDLLSGSSEPSLPAVAYKGHTYALGMIFDPENPSGPFAGSEMKGRRAILDDGALHFVGRRWIQYAQHELFSQYYTMPAGTDESHLSVCTIALYDENAVIEGFSVGDSADKVLNTFPDAKLIQISDSYQTIDLYLRDGDYYTREQYEAAFPLPKVGDEGYGHALSLYHFKTYMLSFRFDHTGRINAIFFGDVRGMTTNG